LPSSYKIVIFVILPVINCQDSSLDSRKREE